MFRILGVVLWLAAAFSVVLFLPLEIGRNHIGPESLAKIAILAFLGLSVIELAHKAYRVRGEHKAVDQFPRLFARMETGDYQPTTYSLRDPRAIRRVNHIAECAKPDISKLHEAIPAAASLDASILASSYGPLTVYAWALPVIGFVGTAMGMAEAIAGFKYALADAQGNLNSIVDSLGNHVIPALGAAFHITIIALISALVVHLCTSAVRDWDQDALTKLDRLCIVMLSRIPMPEGPEGAKIIEAIERVRDQLGTILAMPGSLDESAKTMASASEWLLAAGREMHAAATAPYLVTVQRGAGKQEPPNIPSTEIDPRAPKA